MSSFREALRQSEVLLGDAAMGTWLTAAGVRPADLAVVVLRDPDRITDVHLSHLAAGARVLETATFLANPVRLAPLGLAAETYHINRRAAQLARHARDTFGETAWVLGSVGPLGRPVADGVDGISAEEAWTAYRHQVAGLLAGGVDGFLVETVSDLGSLYAAAGAIREESDLPLLVAFAFSPEGLTLYGVSPEAAAEAVLALPGGPPDAAGANCGSGPSPLLDAVLRMAPVLGRARIPLIAYPNAGQPAHTAGGTIRYPATPDYMAAMVPALRAAGVVLMGGCCGTGAQHLEAMRAALAGTAPPKTIEVWSPRLAGGEVEPAGDSRHRERRGTWQPRLSGTLSVSVELDPPRGPNPSRLLEAARRVREAGADTINIGDSPMARVRMSALATARLVRDAVGVDPIIHCTTRDRNLMGLASDLLGAHALGIRNVLALTGDPPGLGDYAHATAVYDLDSVGLVRLLASFNGGHDGLGHKIGQSTAFQIGVAVNPNADDVTLEAARLLAKLEAGAHFVMTQPLYDPAQLDRLLDVTGVLSVPLVAGVMPLVSHRQAEYLHHEVPGIVIPDEVRAVMEQAAEDGVAAGVDLAARLVEQIRDRVQGLYLVPSYNRVEPLLPLIRQLRAGAAGAQVGSP
jgi:methionine synthase I (cobalamin-dependent)/5,10-methylenetetrahydrofolate reductase